MQAARDWEKPVRRMELLLRLKSFPVAFKMLENKDDLDQIPFMRRAAGKLTMCQLITRVRNFDWTVGATLEDFLGPVCPSIIGLSEVPELFSDGTFRSIVWVKTKADAQKYEQSIPRLPLGKYQAVAMAPLVYNPFEPDIVLIYGNPAQMMMLINALQFEDYEVMQFFCVGESSCSDAIARCYLTGKPALTIPCYGERRYGHAQDEDMVMALPVDKMDKALAGLEVLYRRGIRYPISYSGAETDVSHTFPGAYGSLAQLDSLRGHDGRLLVGVTGSIASGKTAVANMLADLGAHIIDFDVLARQVVEPGQPAWKSIVEYFGRQFLQDDDQLDRKKLSDLVFRDMVKRKKLESFIHPAISHEFLTQVEKISSENQNAVILAVIPLLVELNMQYMFHKILVVHVPPETQVERLMARDGISQEEAQRIISSQIPVDEKVGYADYVIDNKDSLENSRAQAANVWQQLLQDQEKLKEED